MKNPNDIRQDLTSHLRRQQKTVKKIGEKELIEFSVKKYTEWIDDWGKFAYDVFGVTLDREQLEILYSVQHNPRTTVASGTSRGKDFITAVASMCFLYLTPRFDANGIMTRNTKVALTAPTTRQVKNIMQPEFSRLFRSAASRGFPLVGRLVGSDIRTISEEWFLTAFKADNQNEEAWSGFHAANTMFGVTEASGISEKIFEAIEGNLQGNSRIIIVFNPNVVTGYAAKSQKSPYWNKFRLNSLNAANVVAKKEVIVGQVDYAWIVDKLNIWCEKITKEEFSEDHDDFEFEGVLYRPTDIFRRKVLGKFPKVAETKLIPPQWIELANKRWLEFKDKKASYNKDLIMGIDVAGYGRDNSVYCKRYGNIVEGFRVFGYNGDNIHMAYAGEIFNQLRLSTNSIGHIDNNGEGAGTYARIKEMFDKIDRLNPRIYSCKYSYAAKDEHDRDLTDLTGQYKFENLRAYLFWAVRDWLDPRNNQDAMLPPNDNFMEEATEIEYFFKSNGKIAIEPKEEIKNRINRSTDYFDSLANTFNPVFNRAKKKNPLSYL